MSNECLACGADNPDDSNGVCVSCGTQLFSIRSKQADAPTQASSDSDAPTRVLPPIVSRPPLDISDAGFEQQTPRTTAEPQLPPVTAQNQASTGAPVGKHSNSPGQSGTSDFHTSQFPASVDGRYCASWGRRLAALLLDTFYIWSVFALLYLVSAVMLRVGSDNYQNWTTYLYGSLIVLWLGSSLFAFAYGIFPYVRRFPRRGQSPGKQALQIQVQRLDGRPLAGSTWFPRVLLSNVIGILTLGIYWIFDAVWPLFDEKNQALHDKLANTVVVDLRERSAVGRPTAPTDSRPVLASLAAGAAAIVLFVAATAQLNQLSFGIDQLSPTTAMIDSGVNDSGFSESDLGDTLAEDLASDDSTGYDDESGYSDEYNSDGYDEYSDGGPADIGYASGGERLTDPENYRYTSSGDERQMEKVVRQHFQARLDGDYHTAYSKYTYPLTEKAGSESTWSQAQADEGLQSIEFNELTVLSGDRLALGLEAVSDADGCNNWQIMYRMVQIGGSWRIAESIDPIKTPC